MTTRYDLVKPEVGTQSLYQSPTIQEAERQRIERERKRATRLKIIRNIKQKRGLVA